MSFADNVLSITSRKEGLQEKAEVMSAASIILGITFVITKLRTTAITWGQEPSGYTYDDYSLQVYDKGWTPIQIPVKFANKDAEVHSFCYVGVQMDIKNRFTQQFQILKAQIEEVATTA